MKRYCGLTAEDIAVLFVVFIVFFGVFKACQADRKYQNKKEQEVKQTIKQYAVPPHIVKHNNFSVICMGGVQYYYISDIHKKALAPKYNKDGSLSLCGK